MRGPRRLALGLALALVACGQAGGSAAGGAGSEHLLVLAAASLRDAFTAVSDAFGAAHPGVHVALTFAGSHTLARHVIDGAPADVFASADAAQMTAVEQAGRLVGSPAVLARNALAIAVEPGNPLDIEGLADLAEPGVVIALPAPQAPAGAYARAALQAAGVTVTPASVEPDVRAAMSRVALGEADAAIVYASDLATADGRVAGVAIPAHANAAVTYLVATLVDAPNPAAARAFVAFLLADEGRAILSAHGLSPP